MENIALKDLLDLGSNGVLAFVVFRLYDRLNQVTDRLFQYLEEGRADRKLIAEANGLSTQDLEGAREKAVSQMQNRR